MNEVMINLVVEYDWLILQEKSIIDCLDVEILFEVYFDQFELSKNQGREETLLCAKGRRTSFKNT